jgi:hypothetical protein
LDVARLVFAAVFGGFGVFFFGSASPAVTIFVARTRDVVRRTLDAAAMRR